MTNQSVDLVVIGAGATGASVAYEATKRGLKVLLVDGGDIACATSCRSSKLLHGGVRYLELAFKTFDIAQLKLVREALLERSYWLKEAPFLAHKLELVIPTGNYCSKAYYRLGLSVYDGLSGNKNIGNSRLISKAELQKVLPQLINNQLGGVAYSDGQFNDARLNLILAMTAERAGAIVRNYCKVIGFEFAKNRKISKVITQDSEDKQEDWSTKAVINCTGIQADKIRKMADPNIDPRIVTSRGIHIVLNSNLCPKRTGLLLPSTADGRVIFILPFFNHTLVGTTDTSCKVEDACKVSDEEELYLTTHLKNWFPHVDQSMIKSSWAGGRPLLKPKNNYINSSRVVREHEIETLPCGLVSAMGGKWTTCRPIAIETLKAVEKILNITLPSPKHQPLIGTSTNSFQTLQDLELQKIELAKYLPSTSLLDKQLEHLQGKYGLSALGIIASSSQSKRQPLSEVIPFCEAEVEHDIKHEHARTPTDLLARRCRLAMIDIKEAERVLPIVQEKLIQFRLPSGELDLEH